MERAFSLAWAKTGKRMAARIAMIAITPSSSIRVKGRWRALASRMRWLKECLPMAVLPEVSDESLARDPGQVVGEARRLVNVRPGVLRGRDHQDRVRIVETSASGMQQ